MKTKELYDLSHSIAGEYLSKYEYPWDALKGINDLIIELGNKLDKNEYKEIKENVWVHNTCNIFESAYINGPCIIGKGTEVRQCAFIRGSVLIGENCVIGNSCEFKNVIIFDNVQVPHFNYVGDSILGYKSHMGAGSITSNVKSDKKNVVVHDKENIETGLKKFGAMIGDFTEVGCNSVLNPGTVLGRNVSVYPCTCVRGVVEENTIYKNNGEKVKREQ